MPAVRKTFTVLGMVFSPDHTAVLARVEATSCKAARAKFDKAAEAAGLAGWENLFVFAGEPPPLNTDYLDWGTLS